MKKAILVGNSGHALVVAEILLLTNYIILGYFDKTATTKSAFGLSYLGTEDDVDLVRAFSNSETSYAMGLGNNSLRKKVDKYLSQFPWQALTVIHPRAIVSSKAEISLGALVAAGATINPSAKVGRASIINTGSIIEHGCYVGNYAHIAPGAVLTGDVSVADGSFVGANATIKQGIQVGADVIVGASSVVLRNIPDNEIWAGNPARKIGFNHG